ncbi:hypothetical protein DP187_21795 [Enterobacter cloacae]|nr:hypothetical protein DP187_21795 [Enterobacter cloacae]
MLKKECTIVFDADPFCFGPISTTLHIVEQLKCRNNLPDNCKIILLGTLTTCQLAEKSGLFDAIYECNTTSMHDLKKYKKLITDADLYISNTNLSSIEFAVETGTPVIYVDTLFWMWNTLPTDLNIADKVFIQDFHGVEENISRLSDIVGNYQIVSPLIPAVQHDDRDNTGGILISLGGIDTVYATTTDFWFHFLRDLLALPALQKKEITIAGGGYSINRLADIFAQSHPHVTIGCFSKSDFMKHLGRASKVLATPGLTTFYECQGLKKDVFFLPPQNYSQQLQLKTYLEHYPSSVKGFLWESGYGYPDIKRHLPEKEGIALVQKCINHYLQSPREVQRAMALIDDFLKRERTTIEVCSKYKLTTPDTTISRYIEDKLSHDNELTADCN